MPEPAPYAVLLAAGASSRFGGPKLLAPLWGRPLVTHAAGTLAEAIASGLLAGGVVVVPAKATALARLLGALGMRLVENPTPEAGLASSLQTGLAAVDRVTPPAGAALIVLADQPLLSTITIAALVDAWRARRGSFRPRYALQPTEPGHPVLLDRSSWPLVRTLRGDTGLGPAFRAHPDTMVVIDLPGANPEVDTPADLRALEARGSIPPVGPRLD